MFPSTVTYAGYVPCSREGAERIGWQRGCVMTSVGMSDDESVTVLTVRVDGQHVAFPLGDVYEVLPAVETTELAHAPGVVRGVVNLRGEPLPVIDLRTRLGLPSRDAEADDHVLVCQVRDRRVGVWVDRAHNVDTLSSASFAPIPADSPTRHLAGVALLDDGLLLVSDVDSFLSAEELARLDLAMSEEESSDV